MPRSPHRRSPPPPPLISHDMSMRGRMRSPDMRHYEMPSRGRMPHDYRPGPSSRRSRSPPLKRRSFTPPPLKRKISPPIRELPRRTKVGKVARDDEPDPTPYSSGRGDPEFIRNSAGRSDRYREKEYKEERERAALPLFRGPDSSIDYDIDVLKKFTVEIVRNHDGPSRSGKHINRTITNPDDIAPVRRPDEGVRPLFLKAEMAAGSSKSKDYGDLDEYRRVVAMDSGRYSGRNERGRSPPPPYYDEPKRPFYPEHREHSPYDRHRSPPRHEFMESREKIRERRGSSKEDLRRDLDIKRRDERRYSPDRLSYERESDLRKRIIEKRTEPFPRGEDREPSKRYEGDWEKHPRIRHSPPPRSFDHGFRPNRDEGWRGRDDWKGPPREDRGRERFEDFDRDGPPLHKEDFPPKKYFKHYEEKEFIPHSSRGRGSPSFRRGGGPPFVRGRGSFRGFRGGSSGMSRGAPRGSFRSRGFHSRRPAF